MSTIVALSSNASKWQMGFNSAFKGLNILTALRMAQHKGKWPLMSYLIFILWEWAVGSGYGDERSMRNIRKKTSGK
jgi:hypothetical protein